MSISDELIKLDNVRDALVVSVNSKGGELAEDSTLWQVKNAVDNISSVDTSALSATADDVLEGKTFYGKDSEEPQTGTIPVYTELPDLTPIITWSGQTAIISTPVEKLKTGYYKVSALESLGHKIVEYGTKTVDVSPEINKSDGPMVRITYDGGWHSALNEARSLNLPKIIARDYTPGTEDIVIPPERWIIGGGADFSKGIVIKGDANLLPENIKGGVEIFGVTGNFGSKRTIPENCLAFLGSDGILYVKSGCGVSVLGLSPGMPVDGWVPYGPFTQMGPFVGSVLSQEGVWLRWDGFSDFSKKWTLHTLVSGYPATPDNWPSSTARFAWGFDTQDWGSEGNYEISDLPCFTYARDNGSGNGGGTRDNTAAFVINGNGHSEYIYAASLYPMAFTWDGPEGKAYALDGISTGGYAVRTTIYPYDDETGMPGSKYTVGDKLYIGRPSTFGATWNGFSNVTSGMVIGGFALELNPDGYTDPTTYISPLQDGTYQNL